MYEVFQKLCNDNNVTPYKVCKETGITTATMSNWKAGRYTPKADKMQKIADYFGVSVKYLLTGETTTDSDQPKVNYSVRFGNNEFLLEMMEKAEKLEDEHDKELIMAMLNTMINKNKGKK